MNISDDIHNYNEKLVLEHFANSKFAVLYSADFIDDLFCIVLNQIPPRYIRHEVDMSFYMPNTERIEINNKIEAATAKGLALLKENPLKS
jgi:hypothetical protein